MAANSYQGGMAAPQIQRMYDLADAFTARGMGPNVTVGGWGGLAQGIGGLAQALAGKTIADKADRKRGEYADRLKGQIGGLGLDPKYGPLVDILAENGDYGTIVNLATQQPESPELVEVIENGQRVLRPKREGLATGFVEPGKTRERYNGSVAIQEQFNPSTGQWEEIGRGGRWAPQQPKSAEWIEMRAPSGITFKLNTSNGMTNLVGKDGQPIPFSSLGADRAAQPISAPNSTPVPSAQPQQAASNDFDWDQFQTPKQAAERDPTKIANDLRDEFNKLTKDYSDTSVAYNKIVSASNNPSAAGDISLIFGYMKMIDPGSTVREGEFATAENAQGVPGQVLNMYNKALTGERLPQEVREDFTTQAKNIYGVYQRQYDTLKTQYTDLANRMQVSPRDVIIDRGLSEAPAPLTAEEIEKQFLHRGGSLPANPGMY